MMPIEFDIAAIVAQLVYDPKNPLLFNNGFFVYFFTAFIVLYYLFRNQYIIRTLILSGFSLYFFYKASGSFVILVIISAIVDYLLSNLIYRQTRHWAKVSLLVMSIIVNLGLLFYFKYTNFFISFWNGFSTAQINPLNILLPVGISFYTFENLSYTIDVYHGKIEPERNFLNYLLFLSFFPKLVMGPIVRASDFIPQLKRPYVVGSRDFSDGFFLIVSGLFKKVVISDYITSNFVNYVFDGPSLHTGLECLLAVYGYAIVIYCDFSGYSDVAIGSCEMARYHDSRELRYSLPEPLDYRILAALAHLAFELASRLSLYSAWRQPARQSENLRQPFSHDAAWRFVAWGKLEFCSLGSVAWRRACRSQALERIPTKRVRWRQSLVAHFFRNSDLSFRMFWVDFFQSIRLRNRLSVILSNNYMIYC